MTYGLAMSTIRQDILAPGLATFLLVLMCYISGRVHQFFKQTTDREAAYRDGYNTATRSLFSLATRTAKGVPPPVEAAPVVAPVVAPVRGFASVPEAARHPLPAKHRAIGRRRSGPADTMRHENWPDLKQAS